MNDGIISNWDDMEKVWNYAFNQKLRKNPSECGGVMMTEKPWTPKITREKIVTLLFEKFDV